MARFSDILTRVKVAPEDQEAIIAITSKYPELETSVADAQELQILKTRAEQAQAKLNEWEGPEGWLKKAWDPEHKMTTAQYQAEQELLTLRGKIAQLEAGGTILGEGTMTFDEIDAHLKSKGVLTTADVATLAKADDVTKVKTQLDNQGANYEYLYTRTAHLPLKAMKEFGDVDEKFLPGLFELMGSNEALLKDPEKAYEQYVAPKRLEAKAKELEAKEAAFNQKVADDTAKKAAAPAPTDAGDQGNLTPYQIMEQTPGDNVIDKMKGDAPFGSGQLSRNLAAAYKAGDLKTIQ